MSSIPTLLFRTDASARIGGGHALRCLALAEAYRARGGASIFVMAEGGEFLATRLSAAGVEPRTIAAISGSEEDARITLATADATGAEWIVADGYALAGEYQRRLTEERRRLLCIDDWGQSRPHHATLIVDVNVAAKAADYEGRELLLGPRYALLRQEFSRPELRARVTPPRAAHFLVTFGATDPAGLTLKTLEALVELARDPQQRDWQASVVIGPATPNEAAIVSAARTLGDRIDVVRSTDRISDLMARSDLALTAGGSTLWELAFCGVPMIAVACADNQVANVERMHERGLAIGLGWHEQVDAAAIVTAIRALRDDPAARDTMSHQLQEEVDGAGCSRVLARMDILGAA